MYRYNYYYNIGIHVAFLHDIYIYTILYIIMTS
jgi:hypothetical protein